MTFKEQVLVSAFTLSRHIEQHCSNTQERKEEGGGPERWWDAERKHVMVYQKDLWRDSFLIPKTTAERRC